MAKEQLDVLLK